MPGAAGTPSVVMVLRDEKAVAPPAVRARTRKSYAVCSCSAALVQLVLVLVQAEKKLFAPDSDALTSYDVAPLRAVQLAFTWVVFATSARVSPLGAGKLEVVALAVARSEPMKALKACTWTS